MTNIDLTPFYRSFIGFDHLANLMDAAARNEKQPAYPPYNIEVTGEDQYRITMAVAGFDEPAADPTIGDTARPNRPWRPFSGTTSPGTANARPRCCGWSVTTGSPDHDAKEAEVRALRHHQGVPWYRRLLAGPVATELPGRKR